MYFALFVFFSSVTWSAPTETSLLSSSSYEDLKKRAFSEAEDMATRWKSLVKMSELKKNESLKDLKVALKSETWYMRNAALLALETFDPKEAYRAAKAQLEDPALVVRSSAVEILIKTGEKESELRALLWKELEDSQNFVKKKSLWIRPQIIKYLAQKPLVSERERFLKLIDEGEESIRELAQKAIR